MSAQVIQLVSKKKPSNFVDGCYAARVAIQLRNGTTMRAFLAGFISTLDARALADAAEICVIEATFRDQSNGKNGISSN